MKVSYPPSSEVESGLEGVGLPTLSVASERSSRALQSAREEMVCTIRLPSYMVHVARRNHRKR